MVTSDHPFLRPTLSGVLRFVMQKAANSGLKKLQEHEIEGEFFTQLKKVGVPEARALFLRDQIVRGNSNAKLSELYDPEDIANELNQRLERLPNPQQPTPGLQTPEQVEFELAVVAMARTLLTVEARNRNAERAVQDRLPRDRDDLFPLITEALEAQKRRREAPISTASSDLATVLQQSGQDRAQISVDAQGRPRINGEVNLTLTASGKNAKKLRDFLQSSGESVDLDSGDGEVELTLGNAELDRIYFPPVQGKHLGFRLEVPPTKMSARFRVEANGKSAHVDGTLTIAHSTGFTELFLGTADLHQVFIPDTATGGKHRLHYNTHGQPFGENMRSILNALYLTTCSDAVISVVSLTRPDGQKYYVPNREQRLFRSINALPDAQEILQIQQTLLELATIAEGLGADRAEFRLVDLTEEGIEILDQLRSLMQQADEEKMTTATLTVTPEIADALTPESVESQIVHTLIFSLGGVAVKAIVHLSIEKVLEIEHHGQNSRLVHAEVRRYKPQWSLLSSDHNFADHINDPPLE